MIEVSESLPVLIEHNWFDFLSLSANIILGLTAIISLWLSRKSFLKSEFNSAMNTSPSIIVRPESIWVGVRHSEDQNGYGVFDQGSVIKKDSQHFQIAFCIEFECFNAGRGVAFNISQPITKGMPISDFRDNKTPLYQTTDDNPFRVGLMLRKDFKYFYEHAEEAIPVELILRYTNDQNNVFCESIWEAKIKPFDKQGEDLLVREIRLLGRSGQIKYTQKTTSAPK